MPSTTDRIPWPAKSPWGPLTSFCAMMTAKVGPPAASTRIEADVVRLAQNICMAQMFASSPVPVLLNLLLIRLGIDWSNAANADRIRLVVQILASKQASKDEDEWLEHIAAKRSVHRRLPPPDQAAAAGRATR